MSPSKIARRSTTVLAVIGGIAVTAAIAIGFTGWPPARAFAEEVPATGLGVSAASVVPLSVGGKDSSKFGSARQSNAVVVKNKPVSPLLVAAPKARCSVSKRRARTAPTMRGSWRTARVSWYGPGFYGRTMAGGGRLQRSSVVLAHRSLPFGTKVLMSYRGRNVVAVVRDRGPYVSGRTFDLGPGTARRLGFSGVGTVKYKVIGRR